MQSIVGYKSTQSLLAMQTRTRLLWFEVLSIGTELRTVY